MGRERFGDERAKKGGEGEKRGGKGRNGEGRGGGSARRRFRDRPRPLQRTGTYPPISTGSCGMLRTGDDVLLEIPVELDEERAVAGDPHHEVPVLIRVLLGVPQRVGAHHVDLDFHPLHVEVRLYQAPQLLSTLHPLHRVGVKPHVEERPVIATELIEERSRFQDGGGPIPVHALAGRYPVGEGLPFFLPSRVAAVCWPMIMCIATGQSPALYGPLGPVDPLSRAVKTEVDQRASSSTYGSSLPYRGAWFMTSLRRASLPSQLVRIASRHPHP